jgi:hypothetical protein
MGYIEEKTSDYYKVWLIDQTMVRVRYNCDLKEKSFVKLDYCKIVGGLCNSDDNKYMSMMLMPSFSKSAKEFYAYQNEN